MLVGGNAGSGRWRSDGRLRHRRRHHRHGRLGNGKDELVIVKSDGERKEDGEKGVDVFTIAVSAEGW